MKRRIFLEILLFVFISQCAGIVGSFFTASSVRTWYTVLEKSTLNPPSWVFGPVWFLLYTLIGIAVFLVWKKGWKQRQVKKAMVVFGIHWCLNAFWSILFFGLQNPGLALVEIVLLWTVIIYMMYLFLKISKPAFYLLIPYIFWVTFAMYLNFVIYALN